MTPENPPEPLRYAVAVGGGWLVDAGVAGVMTLAGVDMRVSAAAGLAVAGTASYFLQKTWVFPGGGGRRRLALPKFLGSMAVVLGIRLAVLALGAKIAGTQDRVADVLVLSAAYGASFVAGYAISKFVVFRRSA